MKGINNCTCGNVPFMDVHLWTVFPKAYYMQCKCGKTTKECFTAEDAIEEWNRMNKIFNTCIECDSFSYGKCKKHDTVTQQTWTCPDYEKKSSIEELTHAPNKNLLETNFGACADELLGNYKVDEMVDWKAEHEKLAADFYQTADELKKAKHMWTYWFEQHNEREEKNQELADEIKYWTGEYNKVVQENEKLKMKMDQIKEVVE